MAPSGKPLRLTELREELQRLIGKPDGHAEVRIWDVVDGSRFARSPARGVEPRMVFDRHPLTVPKDPYRRASRESVRHSR